MIHDEGVIQTLAAYLKGRRHPVVLAYLFGSHAKGPTTPLSDVDVAIVLDEPDARRRRVISMRNILAHRYPRAPVELVYPAIRDDLGDIEEFCHCVLTHLESHG